MIAAGDMDPAKLETLVEINQLINSDYSDPSALLTTILQSAMRLSEGEASSLLMVNEQNDRLYFEIALGPKGPDVKRFSLKMGEGIAGWVARNNRSLIVNDTDSDERFQQKIAESIGYQTRNIIAVPMKLRDHPIGVIEVMNKKGGASFSEADLFWLETFANQAALAWQNARSLQAARNEAEQLRTELSAKDDGEHPLIYASEQIRERLQIVDRIARADSSVLILGESGVGKELFAEQVHFRSKRANAAFVRVNCAALPETLLESELFGHVQGAFTDATRDRRGRFELAEGGTIFLDEIGELPLPTQAKLLRVLQSRTFEKVGASEPISVDVRIVAATNRNLEQMLADGTFRQDLYFRLNVLPLHVPPLRQRPEDIMVLAEHFLKRFCRETKKQVTGFTPEAANALTLYSWPGNVRELQNTVERAVVMCEGTEIDAPELLIPTGDAGEYARYAGRTLKDSMTLFKRQFIRSRLEQHGWNQTETARTMGIQRTYLSRLIRELEIARE